ncbi:Ig-like domain-containing protein, partial [Mammaliicoccus stepanovicii]
MNKRYDFLPNRLNKYSIRKFTVGTASILLGSMLLFGISNEAKADELDTNSTQGNESSKDKEPIPVTNDSSPVKVDNPEIVTDTEASPDDVNLYNEKTENSETDLQNPLSTEDKPLSNTNDQQSTTEEKSQPDPTQTSETKGQTSLEEPSTTEQPINTNESTKEEPVLPSEVKPTPQETNTTTSQETSQANPTNSTAVTTPKVITPKTATSPTPKALTTAKSTPNTSTESKLITNLSGSTNKEEVVSAYLNESLSKADADAIMKNVNIDYTTATDEEINAEILRASLIQLANNQRSVQTLAAPARTMMRAMATPSALRAAALQDPQIEKSLGYIDNYTFGSMIFDPGTLDKAATLNGNVIPFEIDSYISGSNSGTRYKINLKLDPIIASHVTKISANPSGRTTPIEFVRLVDENGNPTNTWEVNFIRANDGLFGGAEILSQYTAKGGKIELDDTVANILSSAGDLNNNKLNYQLFVRDSTNNKIVRTSESSGYFLTSADSDLIQLKNNISADSSNAFKASSGSVLFDSTAGTNGAFIIDHQIMKNGTYTYNKDSGWSYHFQIDKDLAPYIQNVELHRYDYNGLNGFDKTYNAANKVADLTIDGQGNGTITSADLNSLIEFNNGLPETVGVRMVVKLNQDVNNILTQNAQYDANGNLIIGTTKQFEDYTFAGYLSDKNGLLINHTLGTSTLALQDYDYDGLLDRFERQVSQTNPENNDTDGDGKNDGDEINNYKTSPLVGKPEAIDITMTDTVVSGFVPLKPGALTQTAKVIDLNGNVIGSSTVKADGTFIINIPQSPEGRYTIAIDSPIYANDEVSTFEIVDANSVPTPKINPIDDNDNFIRVNGSADSLITVRDSNNNVIGSVTVPSNGATAVIVLDQPLAAGTVLTSTATKNGRTSDLSPQEVVTDATPPNDPVINIITSEMPTISGTAEPDSTVRIIFPDGTSVSGVTASNGTYAINIPAEIDLLGGELIRATAIDKAGNLSNISTIKVLDVTAPNAPSIDPVNSEDAVITGKAEPASTVTVTFPDGTKGTGVAESDGSYIIDIPVKVDLVGGEVLPITSTDKAGNVSIATTTTVVDITAPKDPKVNTVTSEDTVITGKSEAGTTVTITFPNGTKATSVADQNGNYTINIPASIDLVGGETLSATSTDLAGNVSNEATTVVTDTSAPVAPTINPVTSEDKVVTGTSEPGSTVILTFPDGTKGIGVTGADGNYLIDIPARIDLVGGEVLPVTSTDKHDNVSEQATTTVIDVTAPPAPTVKPVTSDDTVITGTAEANSTVTVTFPDGTTATGTTDTNGNYTINIPTTVDIVGGEVLPVTATDQAGNVSPNTKTTVTDVTAPSIPTINPVTSEDKVVTGTSEPGTTVTVTFPDGTTATGTTDTNGNYTINIPAVVGLVGGEVLPVTSTDKNGNKSPEASTIVTDATAPNAPTVNGVTSEDMVITGTAEANSTVTVTFPDGTTATSVADQNGNYSINIPTTVDLVGGEVLPVTSTDQAGNVSPSTTTTVTDTTAPTVPTVNPVTSEDTVITGISEPGTTVTVTFPDGTTATGTTDTNGNYTIDIPAKVDLVGGEVLPVTSTDQGGNKSDEVSTTVTDTTAPNVPSINPVTSKDTVITGTSEPNSTVTVTFPDGTTATGTTDKDGNYTIDIPTTVDLVGGEVLPVTSTDQAGNVSPSTTTTVTDTTAPEAPTVNPITSEDTVITGKAEPGTTVTVTFPDGTTATGITDQNGDYEITIPPTVDLVGGEVLPVTSTDQAGNKSDEVSTTVTDTTAPNAPSINPVTSEDTVITGTSEPDSTVTITFPDGTTATGTTDKDGNYTIDIPTNVDLVG